MSVCLYSGLSYPACKAHASYYIVICGLSGCTIFFPHYLIKCTIFGELLLNVKCVFYFLYNLCQETFPILIRMQRDIIITLHVMYPPHCQILIKIVFSRQIYEKYSKNSMKISPVGAELFHTGRRTDRHDEAFRNFVKARKNTFVLRNLQYLNKKCRCLRTKRRN
jgi:hypothetical protein